MSTGIHARAIGGGPRGAGRRPHFLLAGWAGIVLGLLLIAFFFGDLYYSNWQQQQAAGRFEHQLSAQPSPPPAPAAAPSGPAIDPRPVDGVDFVIKVPKIGYTAPVKEGVDTGILADGPGHYPTTPWPGQPGNVGVAAHNVYWIQFNNLQPGDSVVLQTRWGDYTYQVTGKTVVNPDNRQVLAPTPDDRLTLTTCWPLWAGAFATQRLIIFTKQVSPVPPTLPVSS